MQKELFKSEFYRWHKQVNIWDRKIKNTVCGQKKFFQRLAWINIWFTRNFKTKMFKKVAFLGGIMLLMEIYLERFDRTQQETSKCLNKQGIAAANKLSTTIYELHPHHPKDACHVKQELASLDAKILRVVKWSIFQEVEDVSWAWEGHLRSRLRTRFASD